MTEASVWTITLHSVDLIWTVHTPLHHFMPALYEKLQVHHFLCIHSSSRQLMCVLCGRSQWLQPGQLGPSQVCVNPERPEAPGWEWSHFLYDPSPHTYWRWCFTTACVSSQHGGHFLVPHFDLSLMLWWLWTQIRFLVLWLLVLIVDVFVQMWPDVSQQPSGLFVSPYHRNVEPSLHFVSFPLAAWQTVWISTEVRPSKVFTSCLVGLFSDGRHRRHVQPPARRDGRPHSGEQWLYG